MIGLNTKEKMQVRKNLEVIQPANTTEAMVLESLNLIQAAINTDSLHGLTMATYGRELDKIVSPEEQDNCVEVLYQFMMITPPEETTFSTQDFLNFCNTYVLDGYLKYKNR